MDIMDEQELRKRVNVPQKEEIIDETLPLIQDEDDKLKKESNVVVSKVIILNIYI